MKELFEIDESLSPRLKWMRRHHISVSDESNSASPDKRFVARHGMTVVASASDELTACRNAAIALKVRSWEELP
jgi:hypothetical protein